MRNLLIIFELSVHHKLIVACTDKMYKYHSGQHTTDELVVNVCQAIVVIL